MIGIIYGLIDTKTMELRYVGQTVLSLNERFKRHMKLLSPNIQFNNWLRAADVSAIVLERDPIDLNEAEMCWIADMREQGAKLLNLTDGGYGARGYIFTPEARAKISVALKGKQNAKGCTRSAETRAKIGAAHKGRVLNPEHRAKLSAANMGHKHSAEIRAKISAAHVGLKHSPETRTKMSLTAKGRFAKRN